MVRALRWLSLVALAFALFALGVALGRGHWWTAGYIALCLLGPLGVDAAASWLRKRVLS